MAEKSRPTTGASASTADEGTPADVVAGATTTPNRTDGPRVRPRNGVDRYFGISARRSTVGRELRGGLTTFFTMAYIVVLNPIILSGADINGNTLPFTSIAAVATVLLVITLAVSFGLFALRRGR